MTLPALEERYFPYLADNPPVHLLVAAYLGIKPRSTRATRGSSSAASTNRSTLAEMPSSLRQALPEGDVHQGLGPVVLDFEELKRAAARRS